MTKKQKARLLRKLFLAKEIVMFALVAVCLTLLVLEHVGRLTDTQLHMAEWLDMTIGGLFLIEFWFEWHFAKDRELYFKRHWFYLLAAVPVPQQTFEILRGLRGLRLVRLLKIFTHLRYENNTRLIKP